MRKVAQAACKRLEGLIGCTSAVTSCAKKYDEVQISCIRSDELVRAPTIDVAKRSFCQVRFFNRNLRATCTQRLARHDAAMPPSRRPRSAVRSRCHLNEVRSRRRRSRNELRRSRRRDRRSSTRRVSPASTAANRTRATWRLSSSRCPSLTPTRRHHTHRRPSPPLIRHLHRPLLSTRARTCLESISAQQTAPTLIIRRRRMAPQPKRRRPNRRNETPLRRRRRRRWSTPPKSPTQTAAAKATSALLRRRRTS